MNKEVLQQAITLFDKGKTYNEIADITGFHSKTISRHLRNYGRLFSKGLTLKQIQEMELQKQNVDIHLCKFCNKGFSAKGGRANKFCSDECYQNYLFYNNTRRCKQCNKLLSPFEENFCSKNCKCNFNRKFCKICNKEIAEGNMCKKCKQKKYRKNLKKLRFESKRKGFDLDIKTCIACNKKYLYNYFNQSQKFCSNKCSNRYYREKRRYLKRIVKYNGMYEEGITLNKVYRKHKGICSICGIKCDYKDIKVIKGNYIAGKNYPSIDHIVPLSRGGSHTWDNVQLLCINCNSIKGNRLEVS